MSAKFYVYEHWRPDRDECFYVGKGCGPRANNMRVGRNRHHLAIQAKLSRMGMCVEVRMVCEGLTNDKALALEIERIAFWRAAGADLANISPGGDGGLGHKPAPETVEKVAAAHRGMKRSPESRARMSEAAKNKRIPPEAIAAAVERMAEVNRGKKRVFSEEHRRKMGDAMRGRKMPDHVKEILRACHVGKPRIQTPETRAKISAAHSGKKRAPISEEHKARISAANKGKVFSEEHKANLRASQKKRRQTT